MRTLRLSTRSAHHRSRRRRAGFSLIELLVALVLLDLALLAVAGTSAAAARHLAAARARGRLATIAQSRVEWVASQPCGPASGGTVTFPGGTEIWSVSAPSGAIRVVHDSIELGAPPDRYVFTSRVPC
jgi:prepilin-type N-terminal cleavage/methylation domain-containing protein